MNYDPIIPKNQLVHGAYYRGSCRNASIARWNREEQRFYHWRFKFGNTFIETIKCPEDDGYYDVFIAEAPIELPEVDKVIPFKGE